jgi:putative Holliday junction resolvase
MMISLDLGSKRVGVSRSDELGLMAHPLAMIPCESDEKFNQEFSAVLKEYSPEKVIVGLPITMQGEEGIAAVNIKKKVERLQDLYPDVVFEFWDERLTTKQAEHYLRESGASQKKRRSRVDSLSAQILLQSYLDANRS